MRWCSDKGIPHSEYLSWRQSDREKLIAFLLDDNARCKQCGTADWEWEENRYAYQAELEFCQGCMHLEAAREDQSDTPPGASIVLVPSK